MNMVLFLTNWPFRTQLFSFLTVSYLLLDPPHPGCFFYRFTKTILEPNMMVPTCCPKTGEVETGGLQIPGQSELYQALIQSRLQSGAVIEKKKRDGLSIISQGTHCHLAGGLGPISPPAHLLGTAGLCLASPAVTFYCLV